MKKGPLTRRTFLGLATSAGVVTALAGCPPPPPPPPPESNGVLVYKRSGRGLRVSNAAKKHNANHLYVTYAAALQNPAHPGDHSKVVQLTINRAQYNRLFTGGSLVADLRHDL